MSGFLSSILPTQAPQGQSGLNLLNDVSIVVGNQQIAGWQSVTLTRSIELFPNSFAFSMTEEYSSPGQVLFEPGDPCEVMIGNDLVITGYVDRYSGSIAPGRHDVEIVGRGKCQDLADCSADLLSNDSPIHGGSVSATNALDLAQKVSKAFGISVQCKVSDLGNPIPVFQVALGETPYEIVERVARYAGYLVYEDENGNMILDRVGTQQMASGFAQGVNVEAAASTRSVDQRFSDLCVVWSTVDQLSEGAGVDPSIKRATVTDKGMKQKRYRPRITVSTQTIGNGDLAQQMATWEVNRRIGRSQSVNVTCDSWRDSAGTLWAPNRLANVNIPALKIVNASWIIGTVTFRKDQSGTHADFVLMPPDAFSVEPSPLNLFDWEINAAQQNQNLAPPTTSPGPGGLLGAT